MIIISSLKQKKNQWNSKFPIILKTTIYATITNGHTWIFFKVFDPKWKI